MLTRDDLGSILEPRTFKRTVWPRNISWLPLALFLYGGGIYGRDTL